MLATAYPSCTSVTAGHFSFLPRASLHHERKRSPAPGNRLWTIEVEREDYAVDGFVHQISVTRRIGNLHHSLTKAPCRVARSLQTAPRWRVCGLANHAAAA